MKTLLDDFWDAVMASYVATGGNMSETRLWKEMQLRKIGIFRVKEKEKIDYDLSG